MKIYGKIKINTKIWKKEKNKYKRGRKHYHIEKRKGPASKKRMRKTKKFFLQSKIFLVMRPNEKVFCFIIL